MIKELQTINLDKLKNYEINILTDNKEKLEKIELEFYLNSIIEKYFDKPIYFEDISITILENKESLLLFDELNKDTNLEENILFFINKDKILITVPINDTGKTNVL